MRTHSIFNEVDGNQEKQVRKQNSNFERSVSAYDSVTAKMLLGSRTGMKKVIDRLDEMMVEAKQIEASNLNNVDEQNKEFKLRMSQEARYFLLNSIQEAEQNNVKLPI